MSARALIEISIDSVNHSAFVKGWKAYDLILACGGRPLWSRRRRMWATSEQTAADVLAMAERDGLAVRFELLDGDV